MGEVRVTGPAWSGFDLKITVQRKGSGRTFHSKPFLLKSRMKLILGLPREGGVHNRGVEQIQIVQCRLLGMCRSPDKQDRKGH
jgi:hypothetical protein